MKKISYVFMTFFVFAFIVSCSKEGGPVTPPVPVSTGVFVMNQGNYGANNTTITYYDFNTGAPSTDFFRTTNGFGLGDTGSDFIIYGGKMYVVMNVSGYVAVTNSVSAVFIDTISFKNGTLNRGPENIVASGSKVFVSSTDGTVAVIDTASLTIEKFISVGSNPAQMAVSGDKLYVSNTGGFSASFDSTLSVIDLHTLSETEKITVGINPGCIAADEDNNLFIACTGDYAAVGPRLVKLDLSTKTVTLSIDSAYQTIRYYNHTLLTTGGYLGAPKVNVLNTSDLLAARPSFVTDGTAIQNPYGLDIDPVTGDVYVGDAKDFVATGEVICFDKTGLKKFSFSSSPGVSPYKTQIIIR